MIGDMGNKRNVECVSWEREKNEAFSRSHSISLPLMCISHVLENQIWLHTRR